MADYLSVKDFGAAGDGETDDTRAFQAAVDEAEKQQLCVVVPGGCYVCGTIQRHNTAAQYI